MYSILLSVVEHKKIYFTDIVQARASLYSLLLFYLLIYLHIYFTRVFVISFSIMFWILTYYKYKIYIFL